MKSPRAKHTAPFNAAAPSYRSPLTFLFLSSGQMDIWQCCCLIAVIWALITNVTDGGGDKRHRVKASWGDIFFFFFKCFKTVLPSNSQTVSGLQAVDLLYPLIKVLTRISNRGNWLLVEHSTPGLSVFTILLQFKSFKSKFSVLFFCFLDYGIKRTDYEEPPVYPSLIGS